MVDTAVTTTTVAVEIVMMMCRRKRRRTLEGEVDDDENEENDVAQMVVETACRIYQTRRTSGPFIEFTSLLPLVLLPPALPLVTSLPVLQLAISAAITDRQALGALLKLLLAHTLEPTAERTLAKSQLSLDGSRDHAVQVIQFTRSQAQMLGQQLDQLTISQEGGDVERGRAFLVLVASVRLAFG